MDVADKERNYCILALGGAKEAHIGYLGEYYCKLVIDECRKLLKRKCSDKIVIYLEDEKVV